MCVADCVWMEDICTCSDIDMFECHRYWLYPICRLGWNEEEAEEEKKGGGGRGWGFAGGLRTRSSIESLDLLKYSGRGVTKLIFVEVFCVLFLLYFLFAEFRYCRSLRYIKHRIRLVLPSVCLSHTAAFHWNMSVGISLCSGSHSCAHAFMLSHLPFLLFFFFSSFFFFDLFFVISFFLLPLNTFFFIFSLFLPPPGLIAANIIAANPTTPTVHPVRPIYRACRVDRHCMGNSMRKWVCKTRKISFNKARYGRRFGIFGSRFYSFSGYG